MVKPLPSAPISDSSDMNLIVCTMMSRVSIAGIPHIYTYAWATSTSLDLSWNNTLDISGGSRDFAEQY